MGKSALSVFVLLFVSLTIVSCQDDYSVEEAEGLTNSSPLTALLASMAANDTTVDNVIDSTSCFSIMLPVEAEVNGEMIQITTQEGYKQVEGIFNESDEDEDYIAFTYPITVMYPDYEQVVVENENAFNTLKGVCDADPELIAGECVAMNFPVTLFIYHSGNQEDQTRTLTTKQDLYVTLQNLDENEYYSLAYPLSLNVSQGTIVPVENNAGLLEAITAAQGQCEGTECSNPAILVNDILFYIPFSEGVVQDLKGNAVNAPADLGFTEDRDGNPNCAVVFNGTQSIQIPGNAGNAITQGEAYSISLWFKMQNTNGSDLENLFTRGNETGQGFSLSVHDLNTPVFVAGPQNIWDDDWNQDANLPVDTQNWHHVVVTVDEDNNLKLYRDGELRNSVDASGANIGNAALDYFIGNNFKGLMDDLRVYKRVLSAEEVNVLFDLDGDCNTCLE